MEFNDVGWLFVSDISLSPSVVAIFPLVALRFQLLLKWRVFFHVIVYYGC